MRQFEQFRASSLYCSHCQTAQPVREIFRTRLAGKQISDYHCALCGQQVGSREMDLGGLPPDGSVELKVV